MKNTAFDSVFNLRKATERMVRTALQHGASHSDILSAVNIGLDAGARGFEPAKLQTPKPQIVRRATKVATAVMLLLFFVAGVADARGALRITTRSLPNAHAGVFYVVHLQAKGGHGPLVWSETGVLPPGLSMNSYGVISGVPQGQTATYDFTVVVKDSRGFRSEVRYGHYSEAV